MKKTWSKPALVVFGDVEALTSQCTPGAPVVLPSGATKNCGFKDAVNQDVGDLRS